MALTPDEIRENKARSAWAVARAAQEQEEAASSHRILGAALLVVAIVVILFFRFAMRRQEREDASREGGRRDYSAYVTDEDRKAFPTDDYSRGMYSYAMQLCQCTDRQCAENVQAQAAAYTGHATDEAAQGSVDASLRRMKVCANLLEK